ncbi:hypothetical protein Trydic_g13223 [Trypoxylus dichotomus]
MLIPIRTLYFETILATLYQKMSTRIKLDDKKIKVEGNKRPKRESSRSRLIKAYYEVEEKPKSAAKNTSPGRKKLPARKKSPARNRSPSQDDRASETQRKSKRVHVSSPRKSTSPTWKSPARKSPSRRSPGRKSPSRTSPARIRIESDIKLQTSVHTSTPLIDNDTESDSDFKPLKPTARGRISRLKTDSTPTKDIDIKRVSISQESYVFKRSNVLSNLNDTEQFSDEDELPIQNKHIDLIESRPYKTVFVTEFGGWFGAISLIVLLPLSAATLHLVCNSKQCSYHLPNLNQYKEIFSYLDVTAFLSITAYSILLLLLTALPFGGEKVYGSLSKYGRGSYIANGWVSLVFVHMLLLGLEVSGFEVVNYIYDKYFSLAMAMILHGILFSIYLYIRSYFVPISALNPNGDTNSIVYNFFMGREINPVILDIINVKIFLLRMAFITLTLTTTVVVLKSLSLTSPLANLPLGQFDYKSLNIDPTCLTLALMWYIYFFDGIFILEKVWSTTFEMQYEGIGYLSCFTYFSLPGMCGTMINNRQKNAFRKNPYSPSVIHLEAIPTAQGKKLIVSGFWGFVRHPNYLGDIIIQMSFFYFVCNVPPGLICLMTIPLLMHRAKRDAFKSNENQTWIVYLARPILLSP